MPVPPPAGRPKPVPASKMALPLPVHSALAPLDQPASDAPPPPLTSYLTGAMEAQAKLDARARARIRRAMLPPWYVRLAHWLYGVPGRVLSWTELNVEYALLSFVLGAIWLVERGFMLFDSELRAHHRRERLADRLADEQYRARNDHMDPSI